MRWQRRKPLLAFLQRGRAAPMKGISMRSIHVLPLLAAILLAGCGGGGSADENGGGAVSGKEAAAAAGDTIKLEPGEYRISFELLEFDVPDAPDSLRRQMKSTMGSSNASNTTTFCLKPEDAEAQGPREMVENMAASQCTFSQFDVSGGSISADMQCAGASGEAHRVLMEGTMTATGSTLTMSSEQTMGAMGKVNMKTRVTSERIGDCS